MRKNRFFGIYYKHQSLDGHVLAIIKSKSNEGEMVQIIDNDKSYILKDISSVTISFEGISFNVEQDDLSLVGHISYGTLLKPKKDIMSYYRYLPIECKHNIYSMYHNLSGQISINNKVIDFNNGNGYIEGDQGRNFPNNYLWLNAIDNKSSITLAVATIPLGLFKILGITCLIEHMGHEYRFGTYNLARVKILERNHILIKKGKYILEVHIDDNNGHALKAPKKGDMVRTIHECPSVPIRYTLSYRGKTILDIKHDYASYEYVF